LTGIIVLMRDTGMRNVREPYRMRVENVDFNNRVIFNPNCKTTKGRRFIALSDRAMGILKALWRPSRRLGIPGSLQGKTHRRSVYKPAVG
jgi:integrase